MGAGSGKAAREFLAEAAGRSGDRDDLVPHIHLYLPNSITRPPCPGLTRASTSLVEPALQRKKTWMAGSSPATGICEAGRGALLEHLIGARVDQVHVVEI